MTRVLEPFLFKGQQCIIDTNESELAENRPPHSGFLWGRASLEAEFPQCICPAMRPRDAWRRLDTTLQGNPGLQRLFVNIQEGLPWILRPPAGT